MEDSIKEVIECLEELLNDSTVPKNTKAVILRITNILKEDVEKSIKINKASHEIESISDDSNLQSYTRTQLWNIASLLEKL
ncbi:UPF0147 family protein [Candidatus Woesearchaeota archaeon]|nr:UPF0147 family protein [Candidatus Woesearchaeota archaeon]